MEKRPVCKLICSDIDGTLIRNDLSVSPAVKDAVQYAVNELGIPFAIASGRFYSSIAPIVEKLGFAPDNPKIGLGCLNGLYLEFGGKVLLDHSMPYDIALKILEYMQENYPALSCIIFDKSDWYIDREGYWFERTSEMMLKRGTVCNLSQLIKDFEKRNVPIYKVVFKCADIPYIQSAQIELCKYVDGWAEAFSSWPGNIETTCVGYQKGIIVRTLAKHLGISTDNVMAFGDYQNDEDMLKSAGISVAVANATGELKAIAKHITLSNEEDGVAAAIRKFLL